MLLFINIMAICESRYKNYKDYLVNSIKTKLYPQKYVL